MTEVSKMDQVKIRIAEQEGINRVLKEKLETKKKQLERAENEKDEEIVIMTRKIQKNDESIVRLKQLHDEQIEYSATVGYLVSKPLKVDYRTDPGNCICLEGKICASSKGDEIQCEFWNCPLINASVDEAQTTMSTFNKTYKQ